MNYIEKIYIRQKIFSYFGNILRIPQRICRIPANPPGLKQVKDHPDVHYAAGEAK